MEVPHSYAIFCIVKCDRWWDYFYARYTEHQNTVMVCGLYAVLALKAKGYMNCFGQEFEEKKK